LIPASASCSLCNLLTFRGWCGWGVYLGMRGFLLWNTSGSGEDI
jgi:hypothetical protein